MGPHAPALVSCVPQEADQPIQQPTQNQPRRRACAKHKKGARSRAKRTCDSLDQKRFAAGQRRRLETRLIPPDARRLQDVPRLVELGNVDRARAAVDGLLLAQQLARPVVADLHRQARWRMAVHVDRRKVIVIAAGADQALDLMRACAPTICVSFISAARLRPDMQNPVNRFLSPHVCYDAHPPCKTRTALAREGRGGEQPACASIQA